MTDLEPGRLACSVATAADAERTRRASLGGPLEQTADQYLVRRGVGRTLVAGYPWFTDWGRDTFIAMRGLCLATGRLDVARDILLEWASTISRGMLPNRFPDGGDQPEYNAVDASLWYVVVVGELVRSALLLDQRRRAPRLEPPRRPVEDDLAVRDPDDLDPRRRLLDGDAHAVSLVHRGLGPPPVATRGEGSESEDVSHRDDAAQ